MAIRSVPTSSINASRGGGGRRNNTTTTDNGVVVVNKSPQQGGWCCCSMVIVYRIVFTISLTMMIIGIVVPIVNYMRISTTTIEEETNKLYDLDFMAYYYDIDTLVYNETVKRASINYIGNDFLNIHSSNLRVVWEGNLHIHGSESQQITTRFSFLEQSATVNVTIDGIEQEDELQKYSEHILDPGNHSIVIEFRNHNNVTAFFSSDFSPREYNTITEAASIVQELITKETKIILVDIEKPLGIYNNLTIVLKDQPDTTNSYFLILTNQDSTHWYIENQPLEETQIVGVVHGSNDVASSVNFVLEKDGQVVPVYYLSDLKAQPTKEDVVNLLGREFDMNITKSSVSSVKIANNERR